MHEAIYNQAMDSAQTSPNLTQLRLQKFVM